jgi:hypothetical protein
VKVNSEIVPFLHFKDALAFSLRRKHTNRKGDNAPVKSAFVTFALFKDAELVPFTHFKDPLAFSLGSNHALKIERQLNM